MIAEATGAGLIAVPSWRVAAWCLPAAGPALVCLASKGETAYGVLLPPPLADSGWWKTTGSAALSAMVDRETIDRVESALHAGRFWLAAECVLGLVGAEQIRALRPASLVADQCLPEPMRAAAAEVGASIIEPVFAPESLLHLGAGHSPIDPVAFAPIYSREAEAVTQWRKRKG